MGRLDAEGQRILEAPQVDLLGQGAIGWLFSAARQRSADERAPGGIFFLPRRWRSAARATEPLGGAETREKQCT